MVQKLRIGNYKITIMDRNGIHDIAILLHGSKHKDKDKNWKSFVMEIITIQF